MALTPNERIEFNTLLEKQKSSEPLMQVDFDRIFELRMKEQLVDLTEEHYSFKMVNRLIDKVAYALNVELANCLRIELKYLGYTFSSEVEFLDFCKENIQREIQTTPYPNNITSYFLVLKSKPHLMPRKILSITCHTSMEPDRGVMSYSIQKY